MCTVGLAVTAVSSALQISQERKNQSVLEGYQNDVYNRTQANSAAAAADAYKGYLERASQTQQAASQDMFNAARESRRALGTAKAGAAEGAPDNVLDAIENQVSFEAGAHQAIRQRNLAWEDQQLEMNLRAVQANQTNRNLQALPSPVQGPDYAGILGNLGASAVDAYESDQSQKRAGYFQQKVLSVLNKRK